ncbi:MAG: YfbK domain-containing protein [Gemmatimonadaceae bacterium]
MPALLVAFILLATAMPIEPWPASASASASASATRAIVVRGIVSDAATGKPIVGANVYVTSATASTLTGGDGAYLLKLVVDDSARTALLRARAVGYSPAGIPVAIAGDTITHDFALRHDPMRLHEVVVTSTQAPPLQRKAGMRLRGVASAVAGDFNTEEYGKFDDNRWRSVASAPLSTFSADVDRASYTNVRRFINTGALPPKDAVRIEELINYFRYAYSEPAGEHPIYVATDVAAAPWNPAHRIVRIGLQTKRIETAKLPPNNLVFLLDVSGSMSDANRLPLVKQAFRLLVNQLREEDRVAIVVYAGAAGLVLPSTSAADKQTILDAIERLEAGGSTAGGAGIALAYDVAKQNFMAEGNNRIILATDGDFNVGTSATGDLVRYVEQRRTEGSALTILGFGMGNIKDNRLEQLADKGNGNYAYVDDLLEAKKVFVDAMGATLLTVAKDVKLQIEFNPDRVQAYRLIGYENRMLNNEDFADDGKDAGDMGAGHSVTALYEIVPAGVKLDVDIGASPKLRYQEGSGLGAVGSGDRPVAKPKARSSELLFVNVRYKPTRGSSSKLLQRAVVDNNQPACDELRFAMAVAGYGMLLRDSEHKGTFTYDDVIALAKGAAGADKDRVDFVSMAEATRRIAHGVARGTPPER